METVFTYTCTYTYIYLYIYMRLHFSSLYSWTFNSKSHTLYFWRVMQQTENSVKATEFVMEGSGQMKNSFFIEFFLNGLGENGLVNVKCIYQESLLWKHSRHDFVLLLSTFLILLSQVMKCLLSIPLRKGILAKPCKACRKTEDIVALSFSSCTYKGKHDVDFRSGLQEIYDSMILWYFHSW